MYPPRITSPGRIRLQIRNRPSTQARIAQVVDNNLPRAARRCRHGWRRPGAPKTTPRLTPATPALPSAAGDPTPAAPTRMAQRHKCSTLPDVINPQQRQQPRRRANQRRIWPGMPHATSSFRLRIFQRAGHTRVQRAIGTHIKIAAPITASGSARTFPSTLHSCPLAVLQR